MENDSASEWNISHEAQNTSEINSFYFYQVSANIHRRDLKIRKKI